MSRARSALDPSSTTDSPLRILMASSEAVPFSKTGGLADVATALAKSLSGRGHEVSLFVPFHRIVPSHENGFGPPVHESGLEFDLQIGSESVHTVIRWAEFPDSGVRVFLVDQPDYFDRPGLYAEDGRDYADNCARFVFFSRAVMEAARRLVLRPDIIHCNDWQTGLIPALLDVEYRREVFPTTASVMTIHNLAYQGQFWHWDMVLTGLDWEYFNWQQMESFGNLNLLKTGIAFADQLTTVSPTYAREIQTVEHGCGLDGILQHRRESLHGILNGIDTDVWDPMTDPLIPERYNVDCFTQGKPVCKRHLQQKVGLPERPEVPLFAMVSRMADQKGFDLIHGAADRLLEHDIQLCFLGTGDPDCEAMIQGLAESRPDRVAARIQFDELLAHEMEAGADLFLMPSRYEPCGLNQLYSLTYGTVPLVRGVGGLADSVTDATPANLFTGSATGFVFRDYSVDALCSTVARAVSVYEDKAAWKKMIRTGMKQDWSWDRSATEYESVYATALAGVDGSAD